VQDVPESVAVRGRETLVGKHVTRVSLDPLRHARPGDEAVGDGAGAGQVVDDALQPGRGPASLDGQGAGAAAHVHKRAHVREVHEAREHHGGVGRLRLHGGKEDLGRRATLGVQHEVALAPLAQGRGGLLQQLLGRGAPEDLRVRAQLARLPRNQEAPRERRQAVAVLEAVLRGGRAGRRLQEAAAGEGDEHGGSSTRGPLGVGGHLGAGGARLALGADEVEDAQARADDEYRRVLRGEEHVHEGRDALGLRRGSCLRFARHRIRLALRAHDEAVGRQRARDDLGAGEAGLQQHGPQLAGLELAPQLVGHHAQVQAGGRGAGRDDVFLH